jgi:hypothetical protein
MAKQIQGRLKGQNQTADIKAASHLAKVIEEKINDYRK